VRAHEVHAFVMFIVQAENRDELKAHLENRGVQALVYYGTPLHLHPAAQKLGYKRGDLPVAERQAARVLALPHHQHLTAAQIAHAASAVNEFYGA
jgi:dTDP-4-amino-4,6-dideoxygalactose transaminase